MTPYTFLMMYPLKKYLFNSNMSLIETAYPVVFVKTVIMLNTLKIIIKLVQKNIEIS